MKATLKRYGVAIVLLFFVIALMIGATLLVTSFGEEMFKEVDVQIKPRGERLH